MSRTHIELRNKTVLSKPLSKRPYFDRHGKRRHRGGGGGGGGGKDLNGDKKKDGFIKRGGSWQDGGKKDKEKVMAHKMVYKIKLMGFYYYPKLSQDGHRPSDSGGKDKSLPLLGGLEGRKGMVGVDRIKARDVSSSSSSSS